MNTVATNTCPEEHLLNGYLTGGLEPHEREALEKHLEGCPYCIYKIAEAYEIVHQDVLTGGIMDIVKKINVWAVLSVVFFLCSFTIPHFFIQFLAAACLFGLKWIIDSKNTKLLIMIYDAWKHGGEKEAGRIIENINTRMRR